MADVRSSDRARPIRIVGAGPAGLTAAIQLARAGREVHVHEHKSGCGMRFSGDLQGVENWSTAHDALDELRACGIETDFFCKPAKNLDMVGGREVTRLALPTAGWYLVERGAAATSLDQRLYAQALAAGVTVHFGSTLADDEADILATGPRKRDVVAVGKGIVFETSAPDMSVMLLGHALARTGYSYLLIADGRGVMCCGIFDKFETIHACYDESARLIQSRYQFDIRSPKSFGGVEGFSLRPTFRRGRALVVGEAAGVQDLLWGFGIRTAVRSGWLAARSLIEGTDYEALARAQLLPGMRASAVARWLWELARFDDYELALKVLRAQRDQVGFMRRAYGWSGLHRALYPIAAAALARRYKHFSAQAPSAAKLAEAATLAPVASQPALEPGVETQN